MERIHALINRLNEQKEQNQGPAQLLATVQLLQGELVRLQQKNGSQSSSKVAVIMPAGVGFSHAEMATPNVEVRQPEPSLAVIEESQVKQSYIEPDVEQPRPQPAPSQGYFLRKPEVKDEPKPAREEPKPAQHAYHPTFDFPVEPPTLTQHQPKKEVHELIGEQKESLNDRLKQDKTELAHVLKDAPIKDLRKGIGINDRFTFINELFRGDEPMYERSIKTINGFNIFSEAEYWMSRELKFKLGWDDSKDLVQHFYQLVRRRFS